MMTPMQSMSSTAARSGLPLLALAVLLTALTPRMAAAAEGPPPLELPAARVFLGIGLTAQGANLAVGIGSLFYGEPPIAGLVTSIGAAALQPFTGEGLVGVLERGAGLERRRAQGYALLELAGYTGTMGLLHALFFPLRRARDRRERELARPGEYEPCDLCFDTWPAEIQSLQAGLHAAVALGFFFAAAGLLRAPQDVWWADRVAVLPTVWGGRDRIGGGLTGVF